MLPSHMRIEPKSRFLCQSPSPRLQLGKSRHMYIQLLLGGERFLYDVGNVSELQSRAMEIARNLVPSATAVNLAYRVPVATHGDAIMVTVQTESEFQVALEVWDKSIRPLQLARQEPLLATFEVTPVTAAVTPPPATVSAASSAPYGVSASSLVTPKKKSTRAAAPSQDDASNATAQGNPQLTNGVINTDWYHSHEKASNLLSSFPDASPTEPPTIRITLRAGQASSRIRFDPYNRPFVNELRQVAQAELLRRLSVDERDRIMAGTASSTVKFLMYMNSPFAPADVDVEEDSDVAFVCDEIKKCGDDYSVQLICEWVDATEVPCAREDVRLVTTDLVEVVLPPRSALTFNLAHTPKREHHEVKSIDMGDEDG